ncbi:MAG: AMP-dependent synthetase and ligase [Firmicutes bacterium]|nr:AMP-dependent synthetase and ligase [Bacillota bacterium]
MSTITLKKTLLEAWIGEKIGIGMGTLTQEQLSQYQLQTVRETICRAYENSPFYHTLLKDVAATEISSLADLQRFPFTTANHIREQALQFLCVSQSDISRIVTLDSSGTTGKAKRIYFTTSDQALTIDFFQRGMSTMVGPGDRVLILLPGERSGSVGDLLITALKRAGAEPILHGVVRNIAETLEIMTRERIDSMVGIPVQVLALARSAEFLGKDIRLKNVLLSTDHVPDVIIQELRRVWSCQVFEHYGMTEMGLGGGLDCEAHAGYHLREADLYFEIIDEQGKPVPDGQEGEVVFTTLTRQGMPLIRYRTGDICRFLPEPCSCGTILRRLERITKRKNDQVFLSEEQCFTMADLDERIFSVPGVLDYTVSVDSVQLATKLNVSIWMLGKSDKSTESALYEALNRVSVIQWAEQAGRLSISVKFIYCTDILLPSPAKRRIMELNEYNGK